MENRRAFIRLFVATALAAGVRLEAFGLKAPQSGLQYTKELRAITKRLRVHPGRWRWIVAHHSAIKYGNAAAYDKAHRRRGMENGLAYHFVIGNGIDSKDGEIEIGSRWLKQLKGGHVNRESVNQVGIGICLVGNFEETKPTVRQLAAFQELVTYLRTEVVGKKIRFAVHKEIDPGHTACPGRHFPTTKMHRLYGSFAPHRV
jgi:hypothetical protein